MRSLILIIHNIRSTHNVGSLLRSSDGFGVEKVIFSGYTPYPQQESDTRLPHISRKLHEAIAKTALGAEISVPQIFTEDIFKTIADLKDKGFTVVALEQDEHSIPLQSYSPPDKVALIIGEEVHGITDDIMAHCDQTIEIPMFGKKESFNVSVATGIALYHIRVMG